MGQYVYFQPRKGLMFKILKYSEIMFNSKYFLLLDAKLTIAISWVLTQLMLWKHFTQQLPF